MGAYSMFRACCLFLEHGGLLFLSLTPGAESDCCAGAPEAGAAGEGPAVAGSAEDAEIDADEGEWEVAASSHNAARRKKRKQARRAAWVARQEAAAQAGQGEPETHHLGGAADGGDSEDWETDGAILRPVLGWTGAAVIDEVAASHLGSQNATLSRKNSVTWLPTL